MITVNDKIPEIPIGEKLKEMVDDTLYVLRKNMRTQKVWPQEVYKRYNEINLIREKYGSWHSTGEGQKSFHGTVVNSKPEEARMDFFFNEYLRFVDLGVSMWNKAEDVERSRKARYKSRYTRWNSMRGRTHRPALMMEFRHLQRRLGWYMREYYAVKAQAYLMKTFKEYEK